MSSDQNHAWLGYRGDYITQLYEDYFKKPWNNWGSFKKTTRIQWNVMGSRFCRRYSCLLYRNHRICQVFLMFVWLGCSVWGLLVHGIKFPQNHRVGRVFLLVEVIYIYIYMYTIHIQVITNICQCVLISYFVLMQLRQIRAGNCTYLYQYVAVSIGG